MRFAEKAKELGLQREVIQGKPFPHVVYHNQAPSGGAILHIYIDGDGTPWAGSEPSTDPTPRQPLMLTLASMDASPTVYLGRPCYHGLHLLPPCSPPLWTSQRYSEHVVDSLGAVVTELITETPYRGIAWFGFSGGGALAVLLADRFPQQTVAVVTVGANLDTEAWARYAGGQDLGGSLNPATSVTPLPANVVQRHYSGSRDRIVPALVAGKAADHLGAPLTVIEGYGHTCCWEDIWPNLLKELKLQPAKPSL